MTYGVFILKSGKWALHGTYANKLCADQEVAYLAGMLGVQAKVFAR